MHVFVYGIEIRMYTYILTCIICNIVSNSILFLDVMCNVTVVRNRCMDCSFLLQRRQPSMLLTLSAPIRCQTWPICTTPNMLPSEFGLSSGFCFVLWSVHLNYETPRGPGVPPFRLCSSFVHSLPHFCSLLTFPFLLFSFTLLIFFYCPSDPFLPE